MKVSVCMIVRNEAPRLATALGSVKGLADEIVIVDTGSEDGTIALAESFADTVITGWDRMHKAKARNAAMTAANGDWVVILDADEQIADPKGVRQFLEETDAKAVYIRLSFMDGDKPTLSYPQMRIWRKGTFEYQYRAHEVPIPLDGWPKLAHTAFVWEHRPPTGQTWKAQYNLDRLLLDVQENPGVARPLYYLGRQYMYRQEWEKALEFLEEYITKPGVDAADALAVMARCHAGLGQEKERIELLFRACAVLPQRREWWGELAEIYHAKGQDHIAAGLLKCALEQPPPPKSYLRHNWHGSHIHDLLARCLWKLKRYREGLTHALQAVKLSPNSSRLQVNLKWFQDKLTPKDTIEDPVRIFITGCAKSGTTLLCRMFHAFQDVEVIPQEQHIRQFYRAPSSAKVLVGKRHRFSPFSEHLSDENFNTQLNLIEEHDIKVVNIIRDGRDVIFSDNQDVSPRRWVAAMRQRHDHRDLIDAEVKYEDLVTNPDRVQATVAKALGLEIAHQWSSYPSFVPDEAFSSAGEIYRKRSLDTTSIGSGSAVLHQDVLADIAKGFDQELLQAGYLSVAHRSEKGPRYYDGVFRWQIKKGYLHLSEPLLKLVADLTVGSVLDLACGPGFLANLVSDQLYVGIDFSPFALDYAQQHCQNKDAKFLAGDICTGLELGRKFDTVVLAEVLEHLSQPKQAICAAQAHAKERIIITVPVNMDDPAHIQPTWTPADLEALVGPLLSCEKVLGKYWLAVVEVE